MVGRECKSSTLSKFRFSTKLPADEFADGRFLVGVAEIMFSLWLGAYAPEEVDIEFLGLCPYDSKDLDWVGACTHSNLLESIRVPVDKDMRFAALQDYMNRHAENRALSRRSDAIAVEGVAFPG